MKLMDIVSNIFLDTVMHTLLAVGLLFIRYHSFSSKEIRRAADGGL
jgi:hypothetical protein